MTFIQNLAISKGYPAAKARLKALLEAKAITIEEYRAELATIAHRA